MFIIVLIVVLGIVISVFLGLRPLTDAFERPVVHAVLVIYGMKAFVRSIHYDLKINNAVSLWRCTLGFLLGYQAEAIFPVWGMLWGSLVIAGLGVALFWSARPLLKGICYICFYVIRKCSRSVL